MGKMMIAQYQSKCSGNCGNYILGGAWMLWDGTAKCEICAKSIGWYRNCDARTKRVLWWPPVNKAAQIAAKERADRPVVVTMLRAGISHEQIAAGNLCSVEFVASIAEEIA